MAKARKTVSAEIAETITRLIFREGRFPPGSRLPTERDFAQQLGVSRTSIREALKLLHAAGTIEIRHGVGAFVRESPAVPHDPLGLSLCPPDPAVRFSAWLEACLAVEPPAAELAAQRAEEASLPQWKISPCRWNAVWDPPNKSRNISGNSIRPWSLPRTTPSWPGCSKACRTASLCPRMKPGKPFSCGKHRDAGRSSASSACATAWEHPLRRAAVCSSSKPIQKKNGMARKPYRFRNGKPCGGFLFFI